MVMLLTLYLPVPPSVPTCQIQGSLDVGSDVMLFCSSEEGIPTPSYSWEKLDALPRLPHNAMQGITNKLAIGVPFCPNFAGKCHTQGWAQAQQNFPPSLPPVMYQAHPCFTQSHWSWWGWKWMDGSERSRVLWMIVPLDGINPDGIQCSFSGLFFFMLNTIF